MDNRHLDLGLVRSIKAESFGEPGQRTFRLLIEAGAGTISLWLEKQQLAMAGSAIEEVLRRIPASHGREPSSDVQNSFVGELEVHVGTLSIGYDGERGGFSLEAADFESPFELEGMSLLAARPLFEEVAKEVAVIVAAGRPRCPLCHTPLS